MNFDDGLSSLIALAMHKGDLDYESARAVVHAFNVEGYLA